MRRTGVFPGADRWRRAGIYRRARQCDSTRCAGTEPVPCGYRRCLCSRRSCCVSGWFVAAYPWIKSAHILAVIAWMAGLLYLPRLLVYHALAPVGSDQSATFKVMERRLLHGIMNPAMIATLVFGGLLAGTPDLIDWHRGWIWAKLGLVFA